ncbi:YncE family protein [Nannocystis bainbridge]|uniref:Uncharacterized protein n=1 Tax=Nannocystis bainbridge TaxID=2995303 RepID=A0ABT5E7N6_9BACT|nr:hypothetical protein [Nannocystis bainbridge]MDC0721864.1 hypothetical protein [Nannocystis bainbridge]
MPRVSHRWCAAMLLLATCGRGEPEPADLQALRLPTGALLSPDGAWLFVTNSNLDLAVKSSTLVVLNLRALDQAFAEPPAPADAELSAAAPCRVAQAMSEGTGAKDQEIVECEERYFIQRAHSVRFTSGAGNIALDRPIGDDGPWRLLVPSSLEERAVTWIDVVREAGGIKVECGQDAEGECDAAHSLQRLGNDPAGARLPSDPARIFVDSEGYRFAYLPHLLGARMSLIALDAEYGPKITDITDPNAAFFAPEPGGKGVLAGGFAVAQRACDPTDAPPRTESCTRPLLYASHRFWPGVRLFSVETGRDTLVRFASHWLPVADPYAAGDRPYMGEIEFIDPEVGDRLLAVHTTPPSLSLVDTSLGPSGEPLNDPIDSVALCHNPNILAVHRPKQAEAIAFVSCYSDDEIAAVALGSFTVIGTIPVDDGPNELVVDEARRKLYVVHTLASTIGVVELDSASPRRLQMIGRIGLGD